MELPHGPKLFIKHSIQGNVTSLIVYVDNIVSTCNENEGIQRLKKHLASEFEKKT
jgi:hypothetical protein